MTVPFNPAQLPPSWGGSVSPPPPPPNPFVLRTPTVIPGLAAVRLGKNIAEIAFRIVTHCDEGVFISRERDALIVGNAHFVVGDWIVEEDDSVDEVSRMRYRHATRKEIDDYGLKLV